MATSKSPLLAPTLIPAVAAAALTVPADHTYEITRIRLHNAQATWHIVTLWRVPNTGSASNTNRLYYLAVGPGQTAEIPTELKLKTAGDAIHHVADTADKVSLSLEGFDEDNS